MYSALDPLDLVKHSARIAELQAPTIDVEALAPYIEEITQQAADLINTDRKELFLYKNPNGWQNIRKHKFDQHRKDTARISDSVSYTSSSFADSSSSSSGEMHEILHQPWSSIEDFELHILVRQINEFILTWDLSPATKYVVIGLNKTEDKYPFGKIHFVDIHFSKPTPKCPNPLAVAKAYFRIHVSRLLRKDYPVNVTYRFEGYESEFYAMGERKLTSNKFQRYYIDSILHMKLGFYAELCECRNPVMSVARLKQADELPKLKDSEANF